MIRMRGFSLLEIMLALIVVGIGVSLVLTFSTSSQKQTNSLASGNDYSVVTNNILQQFIQDKTSCDTNAPAGACPLQTQFQQTSNMTAYDYLCGNDYDSSGNSTLPPCTLNTLSSDQYQNLKKAGIDLLMVKVSLSPAQSDTPT